MRTHILDADGFRRTIDRLAHEVVEKNRDIDNLVPLESAHVESFSRIVSLKKSLRLNIVQYRLEYLTLRSIETICVEDLINRS